MEEELMCQLLNQLEQNLNSREPFVNHLLKINALCEHAEGFVASSKLIHELDNLVDENHISLSTCVVEDSGSCNNFPVTENILHQTYSTNLNFSDAKNQVKYRDGKGESWVKSIVGRVNIFLCALLEIYLFVQAIFLFFYMKVELFCQMLNCLVLEANRQKPTGVFSFGINFMGSLFEDLGNTVTQYYTSSSTGVAEDLENYHCFSVTGIDNSGDLIQSEDSYVSSLVNVRTGQSKYLGQDEGGYGQSLEMGQVNLWTSQVNGKAESNEGCANGSSGAICQYYWYFFADSSSEGGG